MTTTWLWQSSCRKPTETSVRDSEHITLTLCTEHSWTSSSPTTLFPTHSAEWNHNGIQINGDIAVSSRPTKREADPCVLHGCTWLKDTDGKVYVPYVIANHYCKHLHLHCLVSYSCRVVSTITDLLLIAVTTEPDTLTSAATETIQMYNYISKPCKINRT